MKSKHKITHFFLNSNPWFSAVSDYSLQIALCVKLDNDILYCSEVGSTAMDGKCRENNIPFIHSPIHNQTFIHFFMSLFLVIKILFINKNSLKYIWVFEGREHTLCCITKILFPFLWKNKKLIRVRGQAQNIRSNIISKFIYNEITDKIIFAAECVKRKVQFNLINNNSIVHYYGKTIPLVKEPQFVFTIHNSFPEINSNNLVFLVIGRFDPVKGHDYLMQSYLNAKFKDSLGNKVSTQMVFIGYKANINPQDLYNKYLDKFGEGKCCENRYFLEHKEDKKQLFMIEEKISNIENLLALTSFGVIPSLDSEVICRVGVEFLQSGVPVLSSDVGALPEVFFESQNLIFKAGDPDSLTMKLEESLHLFLNKILFNNLKVKAREIGEQNYSSENYKKILQFIQD